MNIFGSFHIIAVLICCTCAFAGARALKSLSGDAVVRCLFNTGLILFVLESVKQVFIFFKISHGVYDWWYFPFQLCSVPMYLCILLPVINNNLKNASLTFMSTFTFISAAAALIYPEDYLKNDILITYHGFMWHGLLLFISLLIIFSKAADLSGRGFIPASLLYLFLSGIAICINVFAEPLMAAASGIDHSYAAMFYLNPYHISPQILVGTIQKSTNIAFGLVLYMLSTVAAAGIVCRIFRSL